MLPLTPLDHALLHHLKREVEHYQAEHLRTDISLPNIRQDLDRSKREYKLFVAKLRKQGKNI